MTQSLIAIASAAGGFAVGVAFIWWLVAGWRDESAARRVAEVQATERGADLRIANANEENYKRLYSAQKALTGKWRDIADERLRNPMVGAASGAHGLDELSQVIDAFDPDRQPDAGAGGDPAVVSGGGGTTAAAGGGDRSTGGHRVPQ